MSDSECQCPICRAERESEEADAPYFSTPIPLKKRTTRDFELEAYWTGTDEEGAFLIQITDENGPARFFLSREALTYFRSRIDFLLGV